jgi:hypothetical protein
MARSWAQIEPYGFVILLVLIFTRAVDYVVFPIILKIVNALLMI